MFKAPELGDDARHGRADDGLVQRGQEQPKHQTTDGQHQVAARQGVKASGNRRADLRWG